MDANWECRLAALWGQLDALVAPDFTGRMDTLAAELPAAHQAVGLFERASARDSTGQTPLAVPLYRAALQLGLSGLRRRRATIQLASSLRALGDAAQATELLSQELLAPSDELDSAVRGFLALALADLGREREALALSLEALAGHLPRDNQSLARYARGLAASTTLPGKPT